MKNKIKTLIKTNRPEIINIIINPNQKMIPKLQFGKPIEDLSPLLNREDFKKNMLIKIIKKDKKFIEIN
jgi:acetolactate synthase-1/2/3 large subunit